MLISHKFLNLLASDCFKMPLNLTKLRKGSEEYYELPSGIWSGPVIPSCGNDWERRSHTYFGHRNAVPTDIFREKDIHLINASMSCTADFTLYLDL